MSHPVCKSSSYVYDLCSTITSACLTASSLPFLPSSLCVDCLGVGTNREVDCDEICVYVRHVRSYVCTYTAWPGCLNISFDECWLRRMS